MLPTHKFINLCPQPVLGHHPILVNIAENKMLIPRLTLWWPSLKGFTMKIKKPMLSWQPWVMPYWRLSFQLYKAVFKENLCNWNLFAAVMHNIFMIRFKFTESAIFSSSSLLSLKTFAFYRNISASMSANPLVQEIQATRNKVVQYKYPTDKTLHRYLHLFQPWLFSALCIVLQARRCRVARSQRHQAQVPGVQRLLRRQGPAPGQGDRRHQDQEARQGRHIEGLEV